MLWSGKFDFPAQIQPANMNPPEGPEIPPLGHLHVYTAYLPICPPAPAPADLYSCRDLSPTLVTADLSPKKIVRIFVFVLLLGVKNVNFSPFTQTSCLSLTLLTCWSQFPGGG